LNQWKLEPPSPKGGPGFSLEKKKSKPPEKRFAFLERSPGKGGDAHRDVTLEGPGRPPKTKNAVLFFFPKARPPPP